MIADLVARARERVRASAWLPLAVRSTGTVAAVVALAVVGAMPMASAHVQLSSAPPAPSTSASFVAPLVAAESAPPPPDPALHGAASDKLVVLNTASAEELESLPGVGPKRAEAILALRQRLGRFRRVEDLLRVKGLGHASLRKLRPRVAVDPAPAPPPA